MKLGKYGAANTQPFGTINRVVAALVARHFSGFARIKMILSGGALNNLTGFGNAKTFGSCFVGFQFSHISSSMIPEQAKVCQEG